MDLIPIEVHCNIVHVRLSRFVGIRQPTELLVLPLPMKNWLPLQMCMRNLEMISLRKQRISFNFSGGMCLPSLISLAHSLLASRGWMLDSLLLVCSK